MGFFSLLVYGSCVCYGLCWSGTDICLYYLIGQTQSSRSEAAFAGKAFCESLGFVLSQALLAIIPSPALYPALAALWTIPVLIWYARWTFPVELLHSKGAPHEDETNHGSNDLDTDEPVVWHR